MRIHISIAALCALTLLAGAPGPAAAQRLYKHVGPDGKVTFSDMPPADGQGVPLRGAAPAPAPAREAAPAAATATAPPSTGAGPKQAIRKDAAATAAPAPAPQAATAAAPVDPALEKALLVLMGYESIVAEFESVCLQVLPTSFKRYNGAAQTWRSRHRVVLEQYPLVLREQFPKEQAALRAGVLNRTRGMMQPVYSAAAAHKIKWCDQNAEQLEQGSLDLAPPHRDVLTNYRTRR